MRGQGRYFTTVEISKIVQLLSSTDLSITQIAQRMSCSSNAVTVLNKKHGVRRYSGRRTVWTTLGSDSRSESID